MKELISTKRAQRARTEAQRRCNALVAVLIPGLLIGSGGVAPAVTITGDLTIAEGTGNEQWDGAVSIDPGETPRLVSGNLLIASGNGATCASGDECASGYCQDGVCCDAPCGACGQCNVSGSEGTCILVEAGTECRAAAGSCDVAETCNGRSASCPDDGLAAFGTECRAASGPCDVAETCSGIDPACPADGAAPAGTVCRPGATACDAAETCDGVATTCPADVLASAGTPCRAAASACDPVEICSGTSAACPRDKSVSPQCGGGCGTCTGGDVVVEFGSLDEIWNTAVVIADTTGPRVVHGDLVVAGANAIPGGTCSTGADCLSGHCADGVCCDTPCDGACEACNVSGAVGTCTVKPAGTVCRAANGLCDEAETCDGASPTCPIADLFTAANSVCRPAQGPCDVAEVCTGISPACPSDALVAAGASCRGASDLCDAEETCTGTSPACPTDLLASAGTPCRPSTGLCDPVETCTGNSALCPADNATAEQCPHGCGSCTGGDVVVDVGSYDEHWPGEVIVADSTGARIAYGDVIIGGGPAVLGVSCTQGADCASGLCVDGVCCDDLCAGDCESCVVADRVGFCSPRPADTLCRSSAGLCDAAETCDGTARSCPADGFFASGVECRATTGPCDVAEVCTGGSAHCPSDQLLAMGTICSAGTTECESRTCDGASSACPVAHAAAGTQCSIGGQCSEGGECDGLGSCTATGEVARAGTWCDDGESCTSNDRCDGFGRCIADGPLL
ncbi:MAG: hypothetical protein MJE77_14220 [Proteobacteria bacterium]|nr:hypothetical protein [Pseudomonadota bacterium]